MLPKMHQNGDFFCKIKICLTFSVKSKSAFENEKSSLSKVYNSCEEELIILTIFNQMLWSAQTLKFRQKTVIRYKCSFAVEKSLF